MFKFITLTAVLLYVQLQVFSQETKVVSLEDYISKVEISLTEIMLEDSKLKLYKNKIDEANVVYDINLTANFYGVGKKNYNDTSSIVIDYSSGFTGGAAVSGVLPSGTRYSAGVNYEQLYSQGKQNESGFNSVSYDPVIKLRISQPLIYNWFGFIDRYARKDAQSKFAIEMLKTEIEKKRIIERYKLKYMKWAALKSIMVLLEEVIQNAEELKLQSEKKLKNNLIGDEDYQKTVYNLIRYQITYNNFVNEYNNLKNELMAALNETGDISPDLTVIINEYAGYSVGTLEVADFFQTKTGHILRLTLDNLKSAKEIVVNKQMPSLNLRTDIDIKFHNYANDSDIIKSKQSYGDVDFIVGLDFVYPLSQFKSKAEYNNIQNLIDQFELNQKSALENYTKLTFNIKSEINLIKNNIILKEAGIASLKKRLAGETKSYNNAETGVGDIIETKMLILSEEVEIINLRLAALSAYTDFYSLKL